MEKNYRVVNLAFYVDYLADEFIYTSIIHNPQSLNIKNTFDLVEKLTPLLHYISSNIKKFIKESEEYYPGCIFSITTEVDFSESNYANSMYDKFREKYIGLFDCSCGIGGLTGDMDIFQKIKAYTEREIEINPYNLLFKNNSFVVEVKHRNMWPLTNIF